MSAHPASRPVAMPDVPLRQVPREVCKHFAVPWCPACGTHGVEVWQGFRSCQVLTEELWNSGSRHWTNHLRTGTVCVYCHETRLNASPAEASIAERNACRILPPVLVVSDQS